MPEIINVDLELDAATSAGLQGWTMRSIDEGSVFNFSIRSTSDGSGVGFVPKFSLEPWNGRPLTKLPMLEIAHKLANCLTFDGKMSFEAYREGEWLPLFKVSYVKQSEFNSIAGTFAFYKRLAHICRFYGVPETLWHQPHISKEQAEGIDLAYKLSSEDSIPMVPDPTYLEHSSEVEAAYKSKAGIPFPGTLRAPLLLRLGETFIADVPVEIEVDFLLLEKQSHGILLTPAPGAKGTMRRDRETLKASV